jgi:hypothetical protein
MTTLSADDGVTRINFWSSPRNVSTAMMYAWRQRADTTVVDEPLYAHYLRVTGLDHPGRHDTLASQNNDGDAVVAQQLLGPWDTPVVFFKQMAKHLIELDRGFLDRCHNILLTRHPRDMLTSFQKQIPDATLAETGFVEMNEILDRALAAGREPIVIDAKVLLGDPEAVLTEACHRMGLGFDPAMLSWPAGPKPEDGTWAPYWYDAVHRSTGWGPWRPKDDELLPQLEPVLAQALPLYQRLQDHAIAIG